MINRPRIFIGTCVLALAAGPALAGPVAFANAAASKASAVTTRVEGAVKRGLEKAASAAERGASIASAAVNKTARKLGLPASSASVPE